MLSLYNYNTGSGVLTIFLINNEAYCHSTSLHNSYMDLPDKFSEFSDNISRSYLLRCLAYQWNISYLANLSGRSNFILKSNLDKSAGSRDSFLLVAHINRVFLSLSNESIFLNKVETILFDASWDSPCYLLIAKASISSINITQGPREVAKSKTLPRFYSPSP